MFFYNIIKLNITLILCRFNSIYKNHFNKQIHNLTQYMERRSLLKCNIKKCNISLLNWKTASRMDYQ